MNELIRTSLAAALIGLGATLTFDLWGWFLGWAFRVRPSSICLLGRWFTYMPQGLFRHSDMSAAPRRPHECLVGWAAHYLTGLAFALGFLALAGRSWLENPALGPALAFGLVTVLAPFLILQPAFGLGLAAARTSRPWHARLRSLLNHLVFGIGLYVFSWIAHWLFALKR